MQSKCGRCGGTYLPNASGEWACTACGHDPPEGWKLQITHTGLRHIITQVLKDLANDLRSGEACRIQSAHEFMSGHPYFNDIARYFQTTPARLRAAILFSVQENPVMDRRSPNDLKRRPMREGEVAKKEE